MDPDFYDENYYLHGKQTGKSSYEAYSWKPDLTLPMADHLKRALHTIAGTTKTWSRSKTLKTQKSTKS